MDIVQDQIFTADVGDKEITFKTGKLAQQAGGAVTVQMGESVLFCTATMSKTAREGIDFLPLSVDYEERLYAAGRIPGSFMRREGRPSERAILTARVTDRPLRPLFPKYMRNDVQVIVMPLAHDQVHNDDMLSIIGASAALTISDIPWDGPVGAARVGLIDGELIVNPTIPEMEDSILDLRVAGTADAIIMVECAAEEVPEDKMLEALFLAHESMQDVIRVQNEMRAALGKEKGEAVMAAVSEEGLRDQIMAEVTQSIATIIRTKTDRDERRVALDDLQERIVADYVDLSDDETDAFKDSVAEVQSTISDALRSEVRRQIAEDGVRPDGRRPDEIRPLWAEVNLVPRVHGSGLFNRGQTQVLSICTLGTPGDQQLLDGVHPEDLKRYMHHYNFPPYSTGETWMMRGPKRREIGHGALAENALLSVIPAEDEFPYTLRVVSEVMSSNGSTSMASVCASCLALMDAGVPIKAPIGGIAMGLIKEGETYTVLTDIQGMEDHLGDMDFKVAGSREGITALQMDIKIKGVPNHVMEQALRQALDARLQILDVMAQALDGPRDELSPYAPRIEIIQIDVDKIGAVIGPGGKNIRAIQEDTNTKIEIKEDGQVFISSMDGLSAKRAIDRISGIVEEAEKGRIYTGKIVRIENYGVFVEILPGTDGLVHISQLADYKIGNIEDEFSVGDEIMVMVTDIDNSGKVRLSRQAVLEGWSLEEARQNDKGLSSGGGRGGNRGGGNRGGNRGGGNRGGNRGGGNRS